MSNLADRVNQNISEDALFAPGANTSSLTDQARGIDRDTLIQRRSSMAMRGSVAIYPRPDTRFKGKKSVNFDMMRSQVFLERPRPWYLGLCRWIAYFFIGFLTGCTAFLMETFEKFMVSKRSEIAQNVMDTSNGSTAKTYAFLAGWAIVAAGLACALTVNIGPGAAGSGMAELMAYLNGVNYPNLISWQTFVIKALCVVVAISAQLFIGKEGPLAHIGANVGILTIYYVPIPAFDFFKNEGDKREFAAAGLSAGVSVAFGAPIGGCLFSYELSKPSTFWTFEMLWKTFFASAVATYTLSLFDQIHDEGFQHINLSASGTLRFSDLTNNAMSPTQIHAPIIMGILGGALGSLFIHVQTYMSGWRKALITTKCRKVTEAAFFAFATMSVCTLFTVFGTECTEMALVKEEALDDKVFVEHVNHQIGWDCNIGKNSGDMQAYNPLATLFFNTEGETIRALFHSDEVLTASIAELIIFTCVWYLFTITTYGVHVPAGLFLPGIITGGALGRLYARILDLIGIKQDTGSVVNSALLGATGMLAGYCRLTYSLSVVMIETTRSLDLYIPMLICMLSSYVVAEFFTQSLYVRALRGKQVPFLLDEVPEANKTLSARVVMNDKLVTLFSLPTVKEVLKALQTGHPSFPVENRSGQLVGKIPSNFLIVLIEQRAWYRTSFGEGQVDAADPEAFAFDSAFLPAQIEEEGAPSIASKTSKSQTVRERDMAAEYSLQEELSQHKAVRSNMSAKGSTKHSVKRQQTEKFQRSEKDLMAKVARIERGNSEFDTHDLPVGDRVVDWRYFCSDMYGTDRKWEEIEDIINENMDERIDLRPYLIASPFICFSTDKIQKCLDIFRHNCLRQLCVINPIDGSLQGVIGREDLFNYMSL